MKKHIVSLVFTGILTCCIAIKAQAQQDSTKKINISTRILGKQDSDKADSTDTPAVSKYPKTFGGITFSRIDWGFSRLINDGSFTLNENNEFLEYKKASNFGFDIAQFGIRFSDQFKTYISTGFEWNYLRLKHNVLLDQDATPLDYSYPDDITYKKNVFTSTYLRVPLTFELRSKKFRNGDRAKLAFGAMTGILIKGSQRLKSREQGSQKFKDNYNLASFQYGAFARLGYDSMGVFVKYYFNDMFENSPNQDGLNNFTFGLTLGF